MLSDPANDPELMKRMAALGVKEGELEESFVRSGGRGGQNVNKTATCVMLKHVPTGLQVKCQTTRHQAQNRLLARRLLLDKLNERRHAELNLRQAAKEKERRQKRPRSRAAKERMLANKSQRATKKKNRRAIEND